MDVFLFLDLFHILLLQDLLHITFIDLEIIEQLLLHQDHQYLQPYDFLLMNLILQHQPLASNFEKINFQAGMIL